MAQARISSLEALRDVKFALQRFIEDAASALTEVDGDGQRTEQWLRFEQVAYWQAQLRQRHDGVEAAKAEFRRKQLTAAPDTPTAIDERRRIERAKVKVDEAEEKLRHLKRWMTVMERERTLYKGQVNSLADALGRELPAAIVRLERMIAGVEAYASLTGGAPASEGGSGGVSAARPIRDPVAAAARLAGLRRRSPGPASRAAAEESVQRDRKSVV